MRAIKKLRYATYIVTVTSEPQTNSQVINFLSQNKDQGGLWRCRDLICCHYGLVYILVKSKETKGFITLQQAARMCNHPVKCENNSYTRSPRPTQRKIVTRIVPSKMEMA